MKLNESVYVAVRADNGMVKIGVSTFAAGRMRALSVQAGASVQLVAILDSGANGPRAREREILEAMEAHSAGGEWLHPSPEIADYIAPIIDSEATSRALRSIRQGAR